mgnify:CR=1 FL=1
MTSKTCLIGQDQVERVLTMEEALDAVEEAFTAYGDGRVQMPPKPYLNFERGDLRCMPAYVPDLGVATVKNVNVHPENTELPTVMGTVTVFDPDTGFALAIMDGTYLTAMRTAAATGVAARYLARPDCVTLGFIGAGRQAETQFEALKTVLSGISTVLIHDLDPNRARRLAQKWANDHNVEAHACSAEQVVSEACVLTTVTPVREPVVMRKWVQPGTHINAIGADASGKQELETSILTDAKVVIDSWEQSSHGGEINVAVSQGIFTREDIHADIGEVVTGRKPGRESREEITVFDSTGLAIQDCACAAHVYERVARVEEDEECQNYMDFLDGSEN